MNSTEKRIEEERAREKHNPRPEPSMDNPCEQFLLDIAFSDRHSQKTYTPEELTRRVDLLERLVRALLDRMHRQDGCRMIEVAVPEGCKLALLHPDAPPDPIFSKRY